MTALERYPKEDIQWQLCILVHVVEFMGNLIVIIDPKPGEKVFCECVCVGGGIFIIIIMKSNNFLSTSTVIYSHCCHCYQQTRLLEFY